VQFGNLACRQSSTQKRRRGANSGPNEQVEKTYGTTGAKWVRRFRNDGPVPGRPTQRHPHRLGSPDQTNGPRRARRL